MILCLLLPGFGYVRSGRMKGFYITIMGLFLVLAGGSVFRLFPDSLLSKSNGTKCWPHGRSLAHYVYMFWKFSQNDGL
jgi:hypothetical protein